MIIAIMGEENVQEAPMGKPELHSFMGGPLIWTLGLLVAHIAMIYIAGWAVILVLAGRFHDWILPLYQHPVGVGQFQFLFSHLFEFSFIPAFLAGFVNARFKVKVAQFVWVVPAVILIFKCYMFGAPKSVFGHFDFSGTIQQYFGRTFSIAEWHSYADLFQEAGYNPDMKRGMEQLCFTAPFLAALGYSLASVICLHTNVREDVIHKLKQAFSTDAPKAGEGSNSLNN